MKVLTVKPKFTARRPESLAPLPVARLSSRAAALLRGKPNVGFDEVRFVAPSVLGHRLILDYAARLEGWDALKVVDRLLEIVPEVPGNLPEDLKA